MNKIWLKGFFTALAVIGWLSGSTQLQAQVQGLPTTVPAEYKGLLDFTKALPTDLSGSEGMKTVLTQLATSLFTSKDAGFSNAASARTADSLNTVGPLMFLTLFQYVFNPQTEASLSTRQNAFTVNSNFSNDLPEITQSNTANNIRSQNTDGFSGLFRFFNTDSDTDKDFQNPFLFQ